jgi:hypothetical protein
MSVEREEILMKPLSATSHGVLDYVVGVFLLVSPWLFGFNDVSTAATLNMVVIGILVLGLSLMTDYPLGLLKLVPFPIHGIIEASGAVFLLASPWIVRFSQVVPARNIALAVAILWLGVVALTNYGTSRFQRPIH